MSTPASFKNHPIHPMLVVFPIGLWVFSFVCDVIRMIVWPNPNLSIVSLYSIAGGIIGALVAAVPGFIDYLSIRDYNVRRTATFHMILNLTAVVLFAINFWLRWSSGQTTGIAIGLSFVTLIILSASGWLGGELVYKHGMGVAKPTPESKSWQKQVS